MSRSTLVRPPPVDASKSWMENVLELTALTQIQPDLFTNTRELWQAPGARGIYGGTAIAQSLLAAFKTVPEPSTANRDAGYLPHSMHCYFILAGDANIPILFHVERVRDGRSFLTRTVQARQRGKCIFTTTISFVAEESGVKESLRHGWDMPAEAKEKLARVFQEEKLAAKGDAEDDGTSLADKANKWPFTARRLGIDNNSSPYPQQRRPQTWLKTSSAIKGGIRDHICALAYMSDSNFIGAVSRVHRLERFGSHANSSSPYLRQLAQWELKEHDSNGGDRRGKDLDGKESPNTPAEQPKGRIGMTVSLDHAIYFHHPKEVKADEWLFSEMEVPWSGEGRGMVTQRMWNKEGKLLASCVQEGLVRLQPGSAKAKESKL